MGKIELNVYGHGLSMQVNVWTMVHFGNRRKSTRANFSTVSASSLNVWAEYISIVVGIRICNGQLASVMVASPFS